MKTVRYDLRPNLPDQSGGFMIEPKEQKQSRQLGEQVPERPLMKISLVKPTMEKIKLRRDISERNEKKLTGE